MQVNSSGAALPFTVSVSNAPWLSVTPTSGTTPATLTLQANPSGMQVGQYSANVVINASGSSQTVAVTLNVSAPLPTISEVHNGASNQPGPIAPGLIIVITGSAMGPDTTRKLPQRRSLRDDARRHAGAGRRIRRADDLHQLHAGGGHRAV